MQGLNEGMMLEDQAQTKGTIFARLCAVSLSVDWEASRSWGGLEGDRLKPFAAKDMRYLCIEGLILNHS